MADTKSDFTTKEMEWTFRLAAGLELDTSDDSINTMNRPLAAFLLQHLLKDGSVIASVVVDNIRGLPKEKASSYAPLTSSQRLSDSSAPELSKCRWGAESHVQDHSRRRLASLAENTSLDSSDMESSLTRAPLVPRRRTSIESLDDISEDENDRFIRGDFDDSCKAGDGRFRSQASGQRQVQFQALQGTIMSELDDRDAVIKAQREAINNKHSNNKCLRSPPKAPERSASLRHLVCQPDLLATNLGIPGEDQLQLDTAEFQKVHPRRYGVSIIASSDPLTSLLTSSHRGGCQKLSLLNEKPALVLEKMYREVCITAEDFNDDDDTEHWDNTTGCGDNIMGDESATSCIKTQINRDTLPSCAKRRPSPQLDKCLFHGCDSTDASPVKAKRRPSPELEAFSCLAEALASVKKQ
jgi:hypothetical protein